jgi:hypothetical protein
MYEARQSKRPVEAIKQEQDDSARTEQHDAAETPPPRPSRSLFQRVALGVAVAAARGVIRRRGKIST